MLADYHMHSSFSDDSEYPMEEEIEQAIALGLEEICFTEHIDYGVKRDINCDCDAYWQQFKRCREIYGDRIGLKFGIEFGMQTHTVREFQTTFDRYAFDFVILSCHQVGNEEFWSQDFQRGRTQREYNEAYYQEILQVMKIYEDYSILGHLDMIRRYDQAGEYPFSKVRDIIAEILSLAIRQGKGIEVNTSCFRYGLADLTPAGDILALYRDLGGEILTIGSDSHREEHVGYKIPEVQQALRAMGYKHIYTYEQMQPVAHRL